MGVEPVVLAELDRELRAAGHGARGEVMERYAGLVGLSPRSLARQLAAFRGARPDERRQRRRDAGTSDVPDSVVLTIWALKEKIRRRNAERRTISTERAIEVAKQEGLIPEVLPASSVNRRARQLGLADHEAVHRFEAERGNQVHQFDCSGSNVFAVAGPGRVVVRDPRKRIIYKNRPDAERVRVWVAGIKDDHSRVRFAKYFIAPGEAVVATLPVLIEAWTNPHGRDFLLRGLPDILYMDKGPLAKSAMAQAFFTRLNVDPQTHAAGNAKATGKQEREWRTWASDFESPFLLHIGQELHLDDLNDRFMAWLKRRNEDRHPRERSQSCIGMWQRSILGQTLRELPEDATRFTFTSTDRQVGSDRSLRLDGEVYMLPAELAGRKVAVWRDIQGNVRVEDPRSGKVYEPIEDEPLAFGEFKAFRRTDMQKALDEAVEQVTAAMPAPLAAAPTDNVVRLQPKAAPVEATLPFGGPRYHGSEEEALAHVAEAIGRPVASLPAPVREAINQYLAGNPSRQDVENFALALRGRVMGVEVVG